ncbi:outer membrane transport energization protein TonB [Sphingobium sp. AP50]|uniref:energy transducer TonB n=1 Tax=Sphingobium sp. AP50 TaxID=1884369 RepID=UPI0008D5E4D3|nr:energy transducer TonB [Sphingobium sp. AP50]SEJ04364.1 outer membrane transport energization protein TonB [Sphingobium sp. AP50]
MRLMMTGTGRGGAPLGETPSRYSAGRKSPLGLGGTVAVHALAIGAFLLIPKEVIEVITNKPFIGTNIPLSPPPEPVVEKKADPRIETQPQQREQPTVTDPVVDLPKGDPTVTATKDSGNGTSIGPVQPYIPPPPPPMAEPVLTEPSIDPRALAAFQPDYPGAMIRQGVEGKVTVRVTISAEGRVTAIEKVSASDESFWLATERHARRKWRFRPATRDGVAVASTKILTVRFTLTQ